MLHSNREGMRVLTDTVLTDLRVSSALSQRDMAEGEQNQLGVLGAGRT